jgi:hypothetical protein
MVANPTWLPWLVNTSHPVNTRVTPSTWWVSLQRKTLPMLSAARYGEAQPPQQQQQQQVVVVLLEL